MDKRTDNIKNGMKMPLVPLRGVVIFPETLNHFDVGRKKSIAAVENAMKNNSTVFFVTQKDFTVENPTEADLYEYGVVAEVKQILRFSDQFVKVLVDCKYRARMREMHDGGKYLTCTVTRANLKKLKPEEKETADALSRSIKALLDTYLDNNPKLSADVIFDAMAAQDPNKLVETLAFHLPLEYDKKQKILRESSIINRLKLMVEYMSKENSVLAIEKEINDKVNEQMDQNQREYYLREQMRVISSELGDYSDDSHDDADRFKKAIEALPLGEADKKKLLKEAERLAVMPKGSQEANVVETYLDTVTDLPWGVYTEDNLDLKNAQYILERDHYGLEKVKERIIEFLAVKNLTDSFGTQIICLIGPPGTGKTSITKSIAEAMGRKFVRLSLGGVSNEAEIRGHRRTYVASMPGRIIDAIKQAETANPLILLDEIDKLSRDYSGDPASALLEVLDPEQNVSFKDHYLDVPFDLSKVLFITTANDASTIPGPLYDRMEIIELSSYTREEKFKIAKQYLIQKELGRNGLDRKQFSISDAALYSIIDDYTREAGVRNLERKIAKLIRHAAVKIVKGESQRVRVDVKNIESILGPKLDRGTISSVTDEVGVANGLAWTSVGGEMLPIQTAVVPGSGKIEVTGNLGDVMKESAKIAITLARKYANDYGIDPDFYKNTDIHIHAPEGAIPKDGPSAGVTLTTSLISALSGIPVRHEIAMTGEITLTGSVLPIGGLKEKTIAAFREKKTVVLIPKNNVSDLSEINEEVRKALKIIPVENVKQVLKLALNRQTPLKKVGVLPKSKDINGQMSIKI